MSSNAADSAAAIGSARFVNCFARSACTKLTGSRSVSSTASRFAAEVETVEDLELAQDVLLRHGDVGERHAWRATSRLSVDELRCGPGVELRKCHG